MDGREENGERGIEQSDLLEGEGVEGVQPEDGSTDVGTEEEDELLKDEDAIETTRRLLGKHKNKDSETKESTEEEAVSDETDSDKVGKDAGSQEVDDIEPPIRLTAEAKQAFKKWPAKAKKEFSSAIRQLESNATRAQQKMVEREKEASHLIEAVRPYYLSKPELAAKHISESQVVTGLIGNHQLLTHDDIEVRKAKLIAIGKSIGVLDENGNFEQSSEQTEGQSSQALIQQAINSTLQQRLAPVESFLESQRRQQETQKSNAITADIRKVMDTVDSVGNYVYPELHDGAYHNEQVKPLVVGLVGSIPNLGYGEATKIAVQHLRAKNGKSNYSNPARLPTNNNQYKQRAATAGVSARGRTTGNVETETLSALQKQVMEKFPVGGN